MRVQFTAPVAGYVVCSATKTFDINEFEAELIFQDGYLREIALETELTSEQLTELDSEVRESPREEVAGEIYIDLPGRLHAKAEETFQQLESFTGLKGVKRIGWDDIEVQLIPESEEERESIDVTSFHFSESIPESKQLWEFDIEDTNWDIVSDLKVPLAFFRRAIQFHRERDFVNSYVNLYFILEGLYSGGRHSDVEEMFLGSEELMTSVETMYPSIEDKLGDELEPFFEFYSKDRSPEGFLELIVVIRHQLSHFFHRQSGPHSPNPFDSDQYRPLSTALSSICVFILEMKVNEIELE